MKAKVATYSDKGPRENLEDIAGAFTFVRSFCESLAVSSLVVLDGAGGHASGEVASKTGLSVTDACLAAGLAMIQSELKSGAELSECVRNAMDMALRHANEAILRQSSEDPNCRGMASTVVLTAIVEQTLHVAWAGDSRCYLVHEGCIRRMTGDHSLVADLVRAGDIDEEEAKTHPDSHVITRYLGQADGFSPEVRSCSIFPGDIVILCTDGITDVVSDSEILDAAVDVQSRDLDLDLLPRHLVELALCKGTGDNCTALCCHFDPSSNLPLSSGRTLTGTYPVQVAQTIRNLKEKKHDSDRPTGFAAQPARRHGGRQIRAHSSELPQLPRSGQQG